MEILDLASSAAFSAVKKAYKKSNKKSIELPSDVFFSLSGSKYNCGFSTLNVMPENLSQKTYYVAGYKTNNVAAGVLDPLSVNAMWLDCGGDGIILVSCDLIGLTGADVDYIRGNLEHFCKKSRCRHIVISCTHTHAGIDTVGYWGKLPKSGKNKDYMLMVFTAVKVACINAYNSKTPGRLFFGETHVPEVVRDGREPDFVNDRLTRFRFVPDNGENETWYLNFSVHPNTLGGANSMISADYPCHIRRRINEDKKVNILFSVGAIGAISPQKPVSDNAESTVKIGRTIGEKALQIENETELKPEIKVLKHNFAYPVNNEILALMGLLKVVTCKKIPWDSETGMALVSEMDLIRLGGRLIVTLPGEAFPEIVYEGGYANAEESATGYSDNINPDPLCKTAGEDITVFGVTNDMTGYVVAPNDFVLHKSQPYLSNGTDRFGRNHYQETNSLGVDSAFTISEEFKKAFKTFNGEGNAR